MGVRSGVVLGLVVVRFVAGAWSSTAMVDPTRAVSVVRVVRGG